MFYDFSDAVKAAVSTVIILSNYQNIDLKRLYLHPQREVELVHPLQMSCALTHVA